MRTFFVHFFIAHLHKFIAHVYAHPVHVCRRICWCLAVSCSSTSRGPHHYYDDAPVACIVFHTFIIMPRMLLHFYSRPRRGSTNRHQTQHGTEKLYNQKHTTKAIQLEQKQKKHTQKKVRSRLIILVLGFVFWGPVSPNQRKKLQTTKKSSKLNKKANCSKKTPYPTNIGKDMRRSTSSSICTSILTRGSAQC